MKLFFILETTSFFILKKPLKMWHEFSWLLLFFINKLNMAFIKKINFSDDPF